MSTHLDSLQDALQAQDVIGWDNFFDGRLSIAWERIQESHYKWCQSRNSGRRWTIALIQKLWDVAWDLWEHRTTQVPMQKYYMAWLQSIMTSVPNTTGALTVLLSATMISSLHHWPTSFLPPFSIGSDGLLEWKRQGNTLHAD
jgi:hypothetical protein